MTEHHFEIHEPAELYVEIGKGSVTIEAQDTTRTLVEISGRDADDVTVTQDGRRFEVIGPRQRVGFFTGDHKLDVRVVLPLESELAVRTGSADITVSGTVGATEVKTGSGDIRTDDLTGPALLESGSGDVTVGLANAELRIKSGSGDIRVRHAESSVAISTGSGDVEIGTNNGPAAVKTGSGDLKVVDARTDVSLSTGSGDFVVGTAHRGRFLAKGASGDIRVGIPAGTPVWTDISTVSGSIRSGIESAGAPADGADHVELRAKTVSGDIVLEQR